MHRLSCPSTARDAELHDIFKRVKFIPRGTKVCTLSAKCPSGLSFSSGGLKDVLHECFMFQELHDSVSLSLSLCVATPRGLFILPLKVFLMYVL